MIARHGARARWFILDAALITLIALTALVARSRPPASPERPPDAPPERVEPPAVPLPPEVAALVDPRALAAYRQRAWIARYGPIRFAPAAPIAEETAELSMPAEDLDAPEVVVDVAGDQARIATGTEGLRVLVWVAFADLVSVPTRTVALRPSPTAPEPADDASAVRVEPGFRFTSLARRGDSLAVHYQGPAAQFDGFLPRAAFGAVFEPRAPDVAPVEPTSRARTNATILDRPGGRAIARLRGGAPPSFEHDVVVVGAEQQGFTPVALVSPSADGSPVVARYLIRGWVRSRDLGLEPMESSYRGASFGGVREPHRARRVAIAAGTPLRREPSGPIIGVAVERGTHRADPAPGGGYWIDVACPWTELRVHVRDARELDAR